MAYNIQSYPWYEPHYLSTTCETTIVALDIDNIVDFKRKFHWVVDMIDNNTSIKALKIACHNQQSLECICDLLHGLAEKCRQLRVIVDGVPKHLQRYVFVKQLAFHCSSIQVEPSDFEEDMPNFEYPTENVRLSSANSLAVFIPPAPSKATAFRPISPLSAASNELADLPNQKSSNRPRHCGRGLVGNSCFQRPLAKRSHCD